MSLVYLPDCDEMIQLPLAQLHEVSFRIPAMRACVDELPFYCLGSLLGVYKQTHWHMPLAIPPTISSVVLMLFRYSGSGCLALTTLCSICIAQDFSFRNQGCVSTHFSDLTHCTVSRRFCTPSTRLTMCKWSVHLVRKALLVD
jgi:hypothetical protein